MTSLSPLPGQRVVFMEERGESKQVALLDKDGLRYLTEGSDWHLYPDIDAAGQRVVMVTGPDQDHLAVETVELSTGETRRWSSAEGQNLHPTFSGDGRTLAYSQETDQGERRIALVNLSNGELEVVPGSEQGFFPALSHDAQQVVYQSSGESRRIVCYDRSLGEHRVVAEGMSPSLSSQDEWVAYTALQHGQWNIHMTHLETGEHRQVTHTPHLDFAPSFTADGGLLLASDRSGQFAIYHISAEELEQGGEQVETVMAGEASYYAPDASGFLTQGGCFSRGE